MQNKLTDSSRFAELIARYGPFKSEGRGGEWSSSGFMVKGKTSDERDPTMRGRGVYTKAQGVRADLLILDDLQDIESIGATARLFKILRQTYFTRAVSGKANAQVAIVMVGNRVDLGDIWEALMEEPGLRDLLDIVTIPAIRDGRSLFPSLYSVEDWEFKRKLVGEDVWFRNYMQQPRASGDSTFRVGDLQACLSQRANHRPQCRPDPSEWNAVTSVDPALGGGTAVLTCAWNVHALRPVDATWKKGLTRNEQIYLLMRDHFTRYAPTHCVFEINTLQKGLARDERVEELCAEFGVRIIEHHTGRGKLDPVSGVGAMASAFVMRKMVIPADADHMDRPHPSMEDLWNQLLAWRPDVPTKLLTQDLVMALWFCHLFWRDRVREIEAASDERWKRAPTPAFAPKVPGRAALLSRR